MLIRRYELLEKYRDGKQVVVFKSRARADDYINRILSTRDKDVSEYKRL